MAAAIVDSSSIGIIANRLNVSGGKGGGRRRREEEKGGGDNATMVDNQQPMRNGND